MSGSLPPRERGQVHTLEAVIGSLLLLTSVLFALQATAVTPLSASTSSQHIENQQQETAQGLLAATAANGSLRPAVLYWNNSTAQYHGTTSLGYYTSDVPNNTFGAMLHRTFGTRGIAFNVYVHFQTPGNQTNSKRLIYRGVPSDNAVAASRTIVLHDKDTLVFANGTATGVELSEPNSFYMSDISPATPLYSVVRVEVVVWRV